MQEILQEKQHISQENIAISDGYKNYENEEEKRLALKRENLIDILGSIRACDQFTLEKFKETDKNRDALEAVKKWEYKKSNIYLHGPVGSGKSHLQSIAIRNIKLNMGRAYVKKISQICREIRACENAKQEIDIISTYSMCPVLGIDDLGQEKITEFVASILYEIIDGRYMNRPGGLIVTSNLSIENLASKLGDDRIPSRLVQMCSIYGLSGEKDWRLE